ncbi:unnamed protein product [Orchesella dallaii]|uniref:Transmembrane protein n=1 Tax=Orchesella dallaii TaxID=48710 RepID=A0ABP1RUZ6_9HEXA
MISSEERRKLKNVYIVLVFFTVLKSCGLILTGVGPQSALEFTYSALDKELTVNPFSDYTPRNVKTEKLRINNATQWIDALLLLEVITCELCPIGFAVMQRLRVNLENIFLWAVVHFILSTLCTANLALRMDNIMDITCQVDIALQVTSVALVLTIYRWSYSMHLRRIRENRAIVY